jgi:hypothetical protein
MVAQLSTLKLRLGIAPTDTTQDDLLAHFLDAVSARFDRECRRTLARTVDATHEFRADETTIILPCYPLETIGKFEFKITESTGWLLQTPDHLIRRHSIINLLGPLGTAAQLARITYTGGYVLPGTTPSPGQFALPKDLEAAATEQAAAWFLRRDLLGLVRHWPNTGTYLVISRAPLLPSVQMLLKKFERWSC